MLRRPVDVAADLSGSILPRRRKVMLTDITTFGAGFRFNGRFNPGDFVMLSVPSFGPFGSVVVWNDDGRVGVRFVQPLHAAVVSHVLGLRTGPVCPIERRWRRLVE